LKMKQEVVNAFIIHGTYGHPGENWFPWLKRQLESLGVPTQIPRFPTPEGQKLQNWLEVFDDYRQLINPKTILIGHSLGSAFILNYLERGQQQVKAALLVSSFIGLLDNEEFDELNATFTDREFDFEAIKDSCPHFYVYHAQDDPYVPLAKAKHLAAKLDAELNVVANAGHFNSDSGYNQFALLFEDIRQLVQGEEEEKTER